VGKLTPECSSKVYSEYLSVGTFKKAVAEHILGKIDGAVAEQAKSLILREVGDGFPQVGVQDSAFNKGEKINIEKNRSKEFGCKIEKHAGAKYAII